ncbi:MAG: hypothetical protein IPJ69_02775 [Deltaproteobacteria bacterium]|nr:MAG: hypothetical protein IPJ69_02775 [Deltaproteobacteria bacterium]
MNSPIGFTTTKLTTLNCRAFDTTSIVTRREAIRATGEQTPLPPELRDPMDRLLRACGVNQGINTIDKYWKAFCDKTKFGPEYIDDHIRIPLIGDVLSNLSPDFTGLTEVWGHAASHTLCHSPYGIKAKHLKMPHYDSFREIFSVISENSLVLSALIFTFLDPTVQFLAQSQLNQTGKTNFGRMENMMKSIEAKLIGYFEGKTFYGPGLQPLSLLDVDHWEFIPFQTMGAGFERYTQKGFVSAKVRLKDGQWARTILTHLAVGDNVKDVEIRFSQLKEIISHLESQTEDLPVIMMGDFNIREGTVEYQRLKKLMQVRGFKNAYREVHPEMDIRKHYTYNDGLLHFQGKLGMACPPGHPDEFQILDYIWVKGLRVHDARIIGPELHHSGYGGKPITDHRGVAVSVYC